MTRTPCRGRAGREFLQGLHPGPGRGQDRQDPAWASAITGIPERRIVQLAREIAGPALLRGPGLGPQRQANGEQTSRPLHAGILTGNVGVQGGNTGARESEAAASFARYPTLTNR